jgi:hypothetical protein
MPTALDKQNVKFVQKDPSVKIRLTNQRNVQMVFSVHKEIHPVVSAQLDISVQMVFLHKHALKVFMHQQNQLLVILVLLVQNVQTKGCLHQPHVLQALILILLGRYRALSVKLDIVVSTRMPQYYALLVSLVERVKPVVHPVVLETIVLQGHLYVSLALLGSNA